MFGHFESWDVLGRLKQTLLGMGEGLGLHFFIFSSSVFDGGSLLLGGDSKMTKLSCMDLIQACFAPIAARFRQGLSPGDGLTVVRCADSVPEWLGDSSRPHD